MSFNKKMLIFVFYCGGEASEARGFLLISDKRRSVKT